MAKWIVEPPDERKNAGYLDHLVQWLNAYTFETAGHRIEPGVVRLRPEKRRRHGSALEFVFLMEGRPECRFGVRAGEAPNHTNERVHGWLEVVAANVIEAWATRGKLPKDCAKAADDEGIVWL